MHIVKVSLNDLLKKTAMRCLTDKCQKEFQDFFKKGHFNIEVIVNAFRFESENYIS